jgi:hypothetical protein
MRRKYPLDRVGTFPSLSPIDPHQVIWPILMVLAVIVEHHVNFNVKYLQQHRELKKIKKSKSQTCTGIIPISQ